MPQCPACKHKHDFWDVDKMESTHKRTEKFVIIKGCTHKIEDCDGYERLQQTTMYGCPKCKIVFLGDDW